MTTKLEPGVRVEKNRPWRFHGQPDESAERHQGTVQPGGHYESLGYLFVLWDEGPPTSVHPWDVHTLG